MTKVTLNKDQQGLIDALMKFWNDPNQKYFVLSGQAGVGKTTCVRYFLDKIRSRKVALTAPTNKAVKVLSESTKRDDVTYKTIYSLLGLTLQANGAIKELYDSGKDDAGSYDLIVIDEGSMMPLRPLEVLYKKTALTHTKILIIGDSEQLPPVGEDVSPIWKKYETNYSLTEVMRHQNAILTFVQGIRGVAKPKYQSPGEEVVIHEDEDKFVARMFELADAGLFHDGRAKAVAWRNVTVNHLNKMIRDRISNTKEPWIAGDRIIFTAPVMKGEVPVASTDEEGVVLSTSVEYHPQYPAFKVWELDIKTESGDFVLARLIHEDYKEALDLELKSLSEKKQWKSFWNLKDAFHSVNFAYALTSHRSQGSTYEYVFMEAGDIDLNRDAATKTKSRYVAASRASKELHVLV